MIEVNRNKTQYYIEILVFRSRKIFEILSACMHRESSMLTTPHIFQLSHQNNHFVLWTNYAGDVYI